MPPVRLVNHLYTRREVKISEGLGGGSRHVVSEPRKGVLLLLIRMAEGESKVARPQETPTKKSRKRKPLKASSGLFEARAPEPLEELKPEVKVSDEVQYSSVPSQGDSAPNSVEGESL